MGDFDVDGDLVRKLADLLAETGLGEIEYEVDGRRIRVARPGQAAADLPTPETAPGNVPPADNPAPSASEASASPVQLHPGTVTSPMVGTVFLSASPDDPPFITPGDAVELGQTLMLIEAMKTFNEVKADKAGRVLSILAENGHPVEYGEPLAIIE